MKNDAFFLGLDIGSVSVAAVLLTGEGAVYRRDYQKHAGGVEKVVEALLDEYPLAEVGSYALTGSGAEGIGLSGRILDAACVQTEAFRLLDPDVRNILSIGGGSFSLIFLDGKGGFRRITTNSACASGTGAFLDQQAYRLGVAPEQLGRIAAQYEGLAPTVATRCAVFAKTDMIHLQQEGFPIEAVAKGLCNGLGASTVDGLLGGMKLQGKTAVVGGVALNECVVAAVRSKLGVETVVVTHPETVDAFGAAVWAKEHGELKPFCREELQEKGKKAGGSGHLRPPLELTLSEYPDFGAEDMWVDENDTEIALLEPIAGDVVRVSMGIDIGSTSTKAVLADMNGRPLAWCYRKTAGKPLQAAQEIFNAFRSLQRRHGVRFEILGVGTTGSGRKMVGRVIGADLVLNEITAHARAALSIDPSVETILELGGQDAKFTQISNGVVYNSVMNYVCAAGTGSFIEEQAKKLDVPIGEFASLAMGVEAPVTSDRCTVYMERDLDLLLASGMSKAQVAAAVLHSVRENYLNKVVGGLQVGSRVLFQGATARNKALVAAFEQRLGIPIIVSPLCHVTGALGMALYVLERFSGATGFRGLEFADEEIHIENEVCTLCSNRCRLSLIRLHDETVAWGLKCGREYEERKPKAHDLTGYRLIKARRNDLLNGRRPAAPESMKPGGRIQRLLSFGGRNKAPERCTIGISCALSMHTYLPFWRTFFESLGCDVSVTVARDSRMLSLGEELITAEFCAPVLAAVGHVRELLSRNVDYIFIPHAIREQCTPGFTNAYFCCYVQAYASVALSTEGVGEALRGKILKPVVDFSDRRDLATALHGELKGRIGVTRRMILAALDEASQHLRAVQEDNRRRGREALKKLAEEHRFGIVLLGRPYNTLDRGMNLQLPAKIAEMGYTVLYQDMLETAPARAARLFPNMYWFYGQQILAAADFTALHPALFPVYFTNFSCGPDSYILTYFKEIMNSSGKPYLVLQMDGHGADAGYLTRIEAALESFHTWYDRKHTVKEKNVAGEAASVPVKEGVDG